MPFGSYAQIFKTFHIEGYLASVATIMERHGDTTEEVNRANLYFQQQFPQQASLAQKMQALDEYIAKLEWAIPRLRADLDEAQRITAPQKALQFHNKLIEASQYDFAGISEVLSFYVGVRNSGVGDANLLDHANAQLLKGRLAISAALTLLRSLASD